MINLTVFCSSKNNLDSIYQEEVKKLVKLIDSNKFNIIYGGGTTGLMGTMRLTWLSNGGNIITSNIEKFVEPDVYDNYVFDNIIDRQKKLVELGDAYLILPGGYGTHYEALEVITKNDIGEALKPIYIFNVKGIFNGFINHINNLIKEGFITRDFDKLQVFIESDAEILSNLINNYL
jgi:hypothetical protein